MPPALLAAAPLVGGAVGASSGGKKGGGSNKAAQQAADRQFQMQQQLFSTALSAWQPAANYYQSLLSGDPTKMTQAVGPTSDILKQQGQAQARELAARMPSGGEANAAQAASAQNTSNSLARLYAGVQPAAASALGQLSGAPMGASAPNVGSGLKFDTHQQEQLSQSKGQLGSGLGTLAANSKHRGSTGKGSGSGTPNYPTPDYGSMSF